MLGDIKEVLRVNGSDLNIEIQDLIESALADLGLTGIKKLDGVDPLVKRAVILYCKAHFGYEDVSVANRFVELYTSLKQHLALSQEYTGVVE